MSFHLIHIMNHGSRLSVNRGCLICTLADKSQRKAPLEDILTVIIAARGVSFSSDAISSLAKKGAIILHCDDSYKPIAKTVRLPSVIHKGIFANQISVNRTFNKNLWDFILKMKIYNQAELLDYLSLNHPLRNYITEGKKIDEGNLARLYWKYFFASFPVRRPKTREYQGALNPINQKLNYGYAVLSAILHRSIVGHGFNASLGIYHKYRFKSSPLVYDLMEPLRPFCDALLFEFYRQQPEGEIREWAKFVACGLTERKVTVSQQKKLKFLYAIDYYVSRIAACFCDGKIGKIFVPKMSGDFIEKT